MSLTTASTLQGFFAAEAKEKKAYTNEEKLKVIETCLKKTSREVERELVTLSPEREKRETVSYTQNDRLRISLSISDDLFKKINRLKDIWSHSNLDTENVLERAIEIALDKVDPMRIHARIEKKKNRNARLTA